MIQATRNNRHMPYGNNTKPDYLKKNGSDFKKKPLPMIMKTTPWKTSIRLTVTTFF